MDECVLRRKFWITVKSVRNFSFKEVAKVLQKRKWLYG
jgi:hypothetical protein